jgi:hypothetical protein
MVPQKLFLFFTVCENAISCILGMFHDNRKAADVVYLCHTVDESIKRLYPHPPAQVSPSF